MRKVKQVRPQGNVSGAWIRCHLSSVPIAAVGPAVWVAYGRMKEDAGRIAGRF
ncbi:hypothetical protein HMPREF9141_1927 [Prevotella multiformis DSM 16608]|uniref:Uncharacterized protein n=1 Tax=Prevotella multiformis DSM 16608 TaxID=888743 RepID=F0F8L0_9BACT|nr:hypothetical protein HMPREF9141_1927 [Prevotella multiformis DSM 16608]